MLWTLRLLTLSPARRLKQKTTGFPVLFSYIYQRVKRVCLCSANVSKKVYFEDFLWKADVLEEIGIKSIKSGQRKYNVQNDFHKFLNRTYISHTK